MRLNRFHLLIGAVCLGLLAAPPVHAKDKAEVKDPNTVLNVVDLAKAKKKAIKKLEKELKKVEGVTAVVVAKKKGVVKVWHNPEVARDDLVAAVKSAGFKVEEEGEPEPEPEPEPAEPEEGGSEYEE